MKLTFKEARELSIKKWEWIVEYADCGKYKNGEEVDEPLFEALPQLSKLIGGCGFCELYVSLNLNCKGCPLVIDRVTCFDSEHPYDKWWNRPNKKNSQIILDLIKNAQEK